MKVFLSSLISGFEEYREAAVEGIRSLGYQVVRAEDFPARPESPQQACLAAVRDAAVVVLVLGERYGEPQQSGLSATHEEYREARGMRPVLAFVQKGVTREPRQQELVREVEAWSGGTVRSAFADPPELQRAVTTALHRFALSQAQRAPEAGEMLSRARDLLDSEMNHGEPLIALAIAGGPRQTILRPAEIGNVEFVRWIQQELLFGPNAVLDTRYGTEHRTAAGSLEITQQQGGGLFLDAQASMRVRLSARQGNSDDLAGSLALIEEDVRDALVRSMRLGAQILGQVDPTGRVTRVALSAATPGAGYMGWQTRAQAAGSGGSVRVAMSGSQEPVHLSPPDRDRRALELDAEAIAEDLSILLKRARGF